MEIEVEEPSQTEEATLDSKPEFPTCFKCVMCGDERHSDDGARLLPCLHHICSDLCIAKARNASTMDKDNNLSICPVCSIMFGMEQTGRNKFTKDYPALANGSVGKRARSVECTVCELGNSATTYCIDCDEFLCTECRNYHKKMRKSSQHEYSTVEEGMITKEKDTSPSTSESETMCGLHEAPIVFYCVECDQELCQMCSKANHHAAHELRDFTGCVKDFREMLSNAIPELIAYEAKTSEALIDLETKATNILGTERVKLLSSARNHFHQVQTYLLRRELELRTEIVKKTLLKAKELNVKRACVQSLKKQAHQYLEVIPKLLEYKDHELFSKRQWLTKQCFRLRERAGVLLDETSYKDYVESEWFFHVGDGVLLETIVALRALGGFIYTDGEMIQEKARPLQPRVPVSSKPDSIEAVFEKKYKDKHPKELTDHLFATRKPPPPVNDGDSPDQNCDSEMEALEVSVENEYIGFDNLKKQTDQNLHIKEKIRLVSGTTLENLLDEKTGDEEHPVESELLSKYIAEKTHNDDESNSEYDPVVQTARGVDKRRNTHSESDDDDIMPSLSKEVAADSGDKPAPTAPPTDVAPMLAAEEKNEGESESKEKETGKEVQKKRGRKSLVKPPAVSPDLPPPQPVRKSSRFEVSPRPGLALASNKARRNAGGKEDPKPPPATAGGSRSRPRVVDPPSSSSGRKSAGTTRTPKGDAQPRLSREEFLNAEEVDDMLGTPTESEEESSSDDEDYGGGSGKRRIYTKKRNGRSKSDDDFEDVPGFGREEKRKKSRRLSGSGKKRGGGKDKEKDEPPEPKKRKNPVKKSDSEAVKTPTPSAMPTETVSQDEKTN